MQRNGKFAVLWDLDGTLVDTGEPHYITWRDTLAEIGVIYTREDFAATFGMNNFGVLAYAFGEKPEHAYAVQLMEKKEELFREIIGQGIVPLPGTVDWLSRFQQWGVKQAVASSAPWENIDAELDLMGLRPFFDAIVSGAVLPHKPNPDVFLKAADELGVAPERCVVIEDSLAGVGGALAAGMKCIAVTTSHSPEELIDAHSVFTDLTEMSSEIFLRLTGWEL